MRISKPELTRNQIFHRVYQTASFIKHQHLQGFKFNLNRAGEIRVANTVGSKSIRIGYPQYIKIYINEKTEFNIFKYLLNNISLSLSRTNSS